MKNTKKAETLVVVMISVIILSFIAMSIFSVLDFDRNVTKTYSKNIWELILKSNAWNIIKKISTKNILEWEKFYIYKDKGNKEYKIFTGSDEKYEMLNSLWDYVDSGSLDRENYNLWIFKRTFRKNGDIIKDGNKDFDSMKYNSISINIEKIKEIKN